MPTSASELASRLDVREKKASSRLPICWPRQVAALQARKGVSDRRGGVGDAVCLHEELTHPLLFFSPFSSPTPCLFYPPKPEQAAEEGERENVGTRRSGRSFIARPFDIEIEWPWGVDGRWSTSRLLCWFCLLIS